jgi:riboflavin kinase/FMN adenylyltransferase
MQLIRGIHNIQSNIGNDKPCVLTIGNFDGVHLGHRRVISALVAKAKQLDCVPSVMVFEPQPSELFLPNQAPARLTRLRDKYIYLQRLGVERLICVNFNRQFAAMTADNFIKELLVEQLRVKHLIIGDDFRFGKNRTGDYTLLQQAGKQLDFAVSDTASYKLQQCRISSTEIRKALQNNDLAEAENMLGRPYSIIGRVFHGDKRGRKLGFPTANVLLKRRVSPVSGVYVVKIDSVKGQYYGVANIGSRPTIVGVKQQLEVHIFDFCADIYGETIEVILLNKLRDEIKFASIERLTEQIQTDSEQARHYVRDLNNSENG